MKTFLQNITRQIILIPELYNQLQFWIDFYIDNIFSYIHDIKDLNLNLCRLFIENFKIVKLDNYEYIYIQDDRIGYLSLDKNHNLLLIIPKEECITKMLFKDFIKSQINYSLQSLMQLKQIYVQILFQKNEIEKPDLINYDYFLKYFDIGEEQWQQENKTQ